MVQDRRHTQLHLEVQEVIPRVFEEQILCRKGAYLGHPGEDRRGGSVRSDAVGRVLVQSVHSERSHTQPDHMTLLQRGHAHCPLVRWGDRVQTLGDVTLTAYQ